MPSVAVLFGGPSPEHDISILTGLQATRALTQTGASPLAIYWAKNGEFFAVEPSLEAKDFVNGVPAKASRLEIIGRPGGGFVGESGRFGKARAFEADVIVNACHGGPGEDLAIGQARFDRHLAADFRSRPARREEGAERGELRVHGGGVDPARETVTDEQLPHFLQREWCRRVGEIGGDAGVQRVAERTGLRLAAQRDPGTDVRLFDDPRHHGFRRGWREALR